MRKFHLWLKRQGKLFSSSFPSFYSVSISSSVVASQIGIHRSIKLAFYSLSQFNLMKGI